MIEDRMLSIMKEKGISQKELATKMNISPSAINAWVKGTRKPDIDKLTQISKILNTSADFLLGISLNDEKKESYAENKDKMLVKIIEFYSRMTEANRHRLYADCLEYLENQNYDSTDKRKGEEKSVKTAVKEKSDRTKQAV